MKNKLLLLCQAVAALLIFTSCKFEASDMFMQNDSEFAEGENVTGEDIFTKRLRGANTFTCNTCHTVNSINSSFRTPGHDITNAAFRTTYKNGNLTSLRSAVNNCVEHWMNGDAWSENNSLWQTLLKWLQGMNASNNDNLSYNIISPPVNLEGGDVISGMSVFNQTCAGCHGVDAVGTLKGPPLAGSSLSSETIARRVRLSGPTNTGVYDGLTGGRMPFWSEDKLSDQELRDIIAFIESTVPIIPVPGSDFDLSLPGAPAEGTCTSNHSAVGSTAELSTFSHQVGGTVRVVDDCTLEISNFSFDGGGINIRLYSGVNGVFSSGNILSIDLLGMAFSGETVTLRLPNGISLDDFNSLSVWCVPIGIDFGSATW